MTAARSDEADEDFTARLPGAAPRIEPVPSMFRRGLAVIRRMAGLHPGVLALGIFGAIVFAAGTVGSAVVLGRVTDDVVIPIFDEDTFSRSDTAWAVAAVAAITFLRVVGTIFRRYYGAMVGERVQRTYREWLGRRYLRLSLAWHRRNPTGELLALVDNDAEMATQVLMPLPFTVGVFFIAVFSAISLVLVDGILAAVAFLLFPLLALLNQVYSRRIEVPAAKVQADVGAVSTVAHESFDGALVVKTLGRADDELERFATPVEQLRQDRVRVGFLTAAFDTVIDALPNLGIVAVILLGTLRIEQGAMSPGDLVQVVSLFSVLSFPMRVFGFFLTSMPPSVVAHERLDHVFDENPGDHELGRRSLPEGAIGVAAHGVRFRHPVEEGLGALGRNRGDDGRQPDRQVPSESPEVLHGVDLAIAPGETVAIVGSTGSGKSTLVTLLAGLLEPGSGRIEIGGVDVRELDPRARTDALALVFQESFLFADSVRANIDVVGDRDDGEVRAAAQLAEADDFVGRMDDGYATVVGERGVTLSGGQRQRVALARALVRRPRLLILDDATSAVDAEVEQQILTNLRSAIEATVVIVAQRVSTIELADRVLYLDDGRIVAAGPHRELLSHPGYEALVRAYEDAS